MLLPPELIDHIFSFLQQNISALKACSKAHPLYSRLAERYLYTDLIVDLLGVSELHKQLSWNSRLLDYPRTLEIHGGSRFYFKPMIPLLIMPMVPRMANLISLRIIGIPCSFGQYEEFISTFTNCLQSSSIEQLDLTYLYDFPMSVLDNGKNIKKLTLSDCTAKEEPISSSPSSSSLETLILSGKPNPDVHIWAMHRVTRLTSLGLRGPDLDWTGVPGLLTACSNSLTTLHLGIWHDCSSTYFHDSVGQADRWIDIGLEVPITLSAFALLKNLSIFAPIYATTTRIDCPLPEIIRLVNTATAIKHVVLSFHCQVFDSIRFLGRLDWSPLNRLESNLTGTRPRIYLCITADEGTMGPSFSRESILDALAGSEVLMDLVKRELVILKSEHALALWEG